MIEPHEKIKILRITGSSAEELEDFVAIEKRVRISVNGKYLVSLYCSPTMIREFVAGVIFNESLITGGWCADRISIEYGDEINADVPAEGEVSSGEKTVTSGCAGGISFSRPLPQEKLSDATVFDVEHIKDLYREFQKKSEGYKSTGGVHSAALADDRHMLVFTEDIGRHNAVDKVIGYALLENIPLSGKIMLASGRLSSEIVSKCARSGIPVIVSRAAPTSLAVKIAYASGVTLVGFVRGERMNVYAGTQRVRLKV
jgi:FdhD protein